MTCANCAQDAVFFVNDPGANPVPYCRQCLPPHLTTRADMGFYPLPEEEEKKADDAPKPPRSRGKQVEPAGD